MRFKLDPSANLNLKEGAVPRIFACQKDQKLVFTVTSNGKLNENKGFSNTDITISYLYMNAPLNFFNELSMTKR